MACLFNALAKTLEAGICGPGRHEPAMNANQKVTCE